MTAIGYVRVSTGRQAREGVSLEAQEAKIRAWAISKGAESVKVFRDEGISGKRASNRPGLRAALESIGKGDALVFYGLSRLARSLRDSLNIFDHLRKRGADMVSLSENFDTTSAGGEMAFQILSVISQFESRMIGDRVSGVWAYKRTNGERTGGSIPFGYSVRGKKLVPEPSEYRTVKEILKRRAQGQSLREIGAALERQGVPRKEGGSVWHAQAVRQVILADALRKPCTQALQQKA